MSEENKDDDVVVPEITQGKVYLNPVGDVVISRAPHEWERHEPGQEDIYIIIPKLFVPRFIERVKLLLAEGV